MRSYALLLSVYLKTVDIDFGFILSSSNSPGGIGFEASPFKLTWEYVAILGGMDGPKFHEYRRVMKYGFRVLRKHSDDLVLFVEMMQKGNSSNMACFSGGAATASLLKQRFQLHLNDEKADEYMDLLINKATGSMWTRLYDQFQSISQGIF